MSNVLFEDRTSYDPEKDAVAHVTLSLQCAPGQVESVMSFLDGVHKQAGVYYGAWSYEVVTPEPAVEEPVAAPVAEPELVRADAAESSSSVVAAADEQGDTHGEQLLQHAGGHDKAADLGQGSDAEAGAAATVGPADADSGVSGLAGESGTGSLKRSS